MTRGTKKLFSLNKQVAIVTGASSGIGRAISIGMTDAGAKVYGLARSPATDNDEFEYLSCDVTEEARLRDACEEIHARESRIDILVNAAGISIKPDDGNELEIFRKTIEVNLVSAYLASLILSDYMERSGGGSIINITSINSQLGFPENPGYVASKGGLRMLTRALAVDFAPRNIRVNAIAPGYVRTGMTMDSYKDPEEYALRKKHMIIDRWGEPEDMVGAAIFLASGASSYMTGQDIFVDGGWTAKGLCR